MVIEKLRQNFKREAAEEAARERTRKGGRKGSRSGRRFALSPDAIINDPRFTPIVTVWGAAVLGFGVLAVSSVDVARVSMALGLGALGALAKLLYAAIAASIGALGGFIAAWLIKRVFARTRRSGPVAAIAAQRVRPIDPALELGSDSLDAPIEEAPFSSSEQPDAIGVDEKSEDPLADEIPLATLDTPEIEEEDTPDEDNVFELSALNELSETQEGQNAPEEVSEEPAAPETPVAENAQGGLNFDVFTAILEKETRDFEARKEAADRAHRAEREGRASPLQDPPTTGIAKLRQSAPQDLSLMQLVERFAAALHEVQNSDASPLTTAQIGQASAERERALAQALKALEFFTAGPTASPVKAATSDSQLSETERDLRDALTRLQSLRGAA
ncbi:MAG: hypothetical protein AAF291_12440 [Pseudomonadota bacterium]